MRYHHSLSSLVISPTTALLVVFGGQRHLLDQISDTHVIELGEYTHFHTLSFVLFHITGHL